MKNPWGLSFLIPQVGLHSLELTSDQFDDAWSVYEDWNLRAVSSEVFLLKLKPNQKELDPKIFDKKEREKFVESDRAEWRQWIQNGVMRLVGAKEEASIPKEKIFTSPMRFIRTNKAGKEENNPSEELIPKSRIILPGHLDPQLGLYRADAPTASALAIVVLATISISLGWVGEAFDISAAFLSGKEIDRSSGRRVFVRAPRDGLPAVDGFPPVVPGRLLEHLKGAYGLTEAPRLWYLRARELLLSLGWEELKCARAIFVLRNVAKRLVGLLSLHVDDGLCFGDKQNELFLKVSSQLDDVFKIRKWSQLTQKEGVKYLGVQWYQHADKIVLSMPDCIDKLSMMPDDSKIQDETPLSEAQKGVFLSYLYKVAWPVRHTVPQMAYGVSYLTAIRKGKHTQEHVRKLNAVIQTVKQLDSDGLARIVLRRHDLEKLMVVTHFDASFAKEPGHKSQSGFVSVVTDQTVLEKPTLASLVDIQSATISRITQSTMAAESASLSLAIDRHLYLRLLLECFLFGEPDYGISWRHKLRVKGVVVTDAKSLYDHLTTTGSVPKERQTLIDLLVARELLEGGPLEIRWVPTTHMLADFLTKFMAVPEFASLLFEKQLTYLKPTPADEKKEDHRKALRQGQRQRRKDKKPK